MHIVRTGEHLEQIAWRNAVPADRIWNHPENRTLKERRGTGDILRAGDVLFIPEVRTPSHEVRPGESHSFTLTIPKVKVRVALRDEDGPWAGVAYRVLGAGPAPIDGQTDGDGIAELSLPLHKRAVELSVPSRSRVFQIAVGALDPVAGEDGVRGRLVNLGFLSEPSAEPTREEALREAVRRFQTAAGLEANGQLDAPTRDALVERHGS